MLRVKTRHIVLAVVCAFVGAFLLTTACADELFDPNEPGGIELGSKKTGGTNARLQSPVRIAAMKKGTLLVSDARQGLIFEVDPATLAVGHAFRVGGRPLAVGIEGNRIFVGSAAKHAIDVYSESGRFRYTFDASVEHPLDLAVDENLGLVFVVDAGAKDVKVFDVQGRLQRVISDPVVPLDYPTGIAVDQVRREILVSDYPETGGNASVKIYDYEGSFREELSPGGCGIVGCSGGFSRPQGIALDGQGRIYLVDAFLAQVLIYDRETLTLVSTLGGRDVGPPELRIPLDVVVGGSDVFVTSNRTATIEVFRNGAGNP